MKHQLCLAAMIATAPTIWASGPATATATTQNTSTGSIAAATGASDIDLAKQLANPLATLISMPVQVNYDTGFGLDGNGTRWLTNVQPVIPITLNDDWNIISRSIIPLINQSDFTNPTYNESGLGDILQSVWLSPAEPSDSGWVWGVGGAFLFPTASHDVLGSGKWGAGPTAVALKQMGPWTIGGLTNHIWSYAGDDDRNYVSSTFVQPFITYITPTKTTFAINTESSFDWNSTSWNIPINLMVSQMIQIGGQPLQLQVGARYWANSPHEEQTNTWGFRMSLIMLFPK